MNDTPHLPRWSHWIAVVACVCLIAALGVGYDYLTIGQPVSAALAADVRNSGFSFSVHRQYHVNPQVLVIDLKSADAAAPVDLLRGLFTVAETVNGKEMRFERVELARSGTPVFLIEGETFSQMGEEYGGDQNPVYLIRTLPEKLYRPDGSAAFGHWDGGLLGVVTHQMQDVTAAAREWAEANAGAD